MIDRIAVQIGFGADWDPREDHCGSWAGLPQQRGSAQSCSIQTLHSLLQTQYGAVQGSTTAQVYAHKKHNDLCRVIPPWLCPYLSLVCSLEGEVRQINSTLESLNLKLSEARSSLSQLEESRMELEKDINCKIHSLFIESEKCLTHRKRYPTISALSGY